jgi:hypothetical protein
MLKRYPKKGFLLTLRATCTKRRLELTAWLTWRIPKGAARERLTYGIPQVNQAVNFNLRLVQSRPKGSPLCLPHCLMACLMFQTWKLFFLCNKEISKLGNILHTSTAVASSPYFLQRFTQADCIRGFELMYVSVNWYVNSSACNFMQCFFHTFLNDVWQLL